MNVVLDVSSSATPRAVRWYNNGVMRTIEMLRQLPKQYSLRLLFIVITLACLWLGWNAQVVGLRRETLRAVEENGGRAIGWNTMLDDRSPSSAQFNSAVSWVRRLLGDHVVEVIYLPSSAFSAYDGERIQAVFPEAVLLPAPFGIQPMFDSFAEDS